MSGRQRECVNLKIGNYAESLRKNRKLTQDQLAEILLIDREEIEEIEKGNYPLSASSLYKICEIFDTTINDFYVNALGEDLK